MNIFKIDEIVAFVLRMFTRNVVGRQWAVLKQTEWNLLV